VKITFTGRFVYNLAKLLRQLNLTGIFRYLMNMAHGYGDRASARQEDREESDISRVLFYSGKPLQGSYLSGIVVTADLMQYLHGPRPMMRDWKKTNHTPTNLAPNRGLPSQHLSMLLVRSYRTFAPLPAGVNDR
jgi:hypothetical protein